jgi:hypothetical protein
MYEMGESVELEISEWLAEKKGFDTRFVEGQVLVVTNKAVLIELLDGDEVWIPLSEVD